MNRESRSLSAVPSLLLPSAPSGKDLILTGDSTITAGRYFGTTPIIRCHGPLMSWLSAVNAVSFNPLIFLKFIYLVVVVAGKDILCRMRSAPLFSVLAVLLLLCATPGSGVKLGTPQLSPSQEERAITAIVEHHSFSPPNLKHYYTGAEMAYWIIRGSTVVTDNLVRLTPDDTDQVGHMWNRYPIGMPEFEIYMGVSVPKKTNGADGMALWVTEYNSAQTTLAKNQLFGHPTKFKGFGILMDTYDNDGLHDNPAIGIVINDGSTTRTFSPQRDFHGEYAASCIFDFRTPSKSSHFATIHVVVSRDGSVSVFASKHGEEKEEHCFTVHGLDLDVENNNYYIGLTAETGAMSQVHDVVFLHTLPIKGAHYDHDVHVLREREGADIYEQQTKENIKHSSRKPAPTPEERDEEDETTRKPSRSHPSTNLPTDDTPPTPSPTPSSPAPTPSVDAEHLRKLEQELEELRKMAKAAKNNRKSSRTRGDDDEDDDDDDDDDDDEDEAEQRERLRLARRRAAKKKKVSKKRLCNAYCMKGCESPRKLVHSQIWRSETVPKATDSHIIVFVTRSKPLFNSIFARPWDEDTRERSISLKVLKDSLQATKVQPDEPANEEATATATTEKSTASVPRKASTGEKKSNSRTRSASILSEKIKLLEEELGDDIDASEDEAETVAVPDVMTKYTYAGRVVDEVLDGLAAACVSGANTVTLCEGADKQMEHLLKPYFSKVKDESGKKIARGISFPTTISVNEILCHHSPFRTSEGRILQGNDVVKMHCGCHIDGYPVSAARTVVVPASNAGDDPTPLPDAAQHAIEAARFALLGMIHSMLPQTLNAEVTDYVARIGHHFGVQAVEGVLSNRTKRWVPDGIDCIIGRRVVERMPQQDVGECEVDENQVWNLDIAFTNSPEYRVSLAPEATTIYRRTPYDFPVDPRVQQARVVLNEISENHFCFPFHYRALNNPLSARMGIRVLLQKGVVEPLPVLRVKPPYITARFSGTVAITSKQIKVLCGLPPALLNPTPEAILPDDLQEVIDQALDFNTAAAQRRKNSFGRKTSGCSRALTPSGDPVKSRIVLYCAAALINFLFVTSPLSINISPNRTNGFQPSPGFEAGSKRLGGSRRKKNHHVNASTANPGAFTSNPSASSLRPWTGAAAHPPRDHPNNVPVFRPSVETTLPQFIDLRTNTGYMSPFDLPRKETEDSTTVLAAAGSPYPGSPMIGSPAPQCVIQGPPKVLSTPGTPVGTPAAPHRQGLDSISPSPRPCPPGEQGCAKLLYRTSENWNETPLQPIYSVSSGGLSVSKSTSDGMDVCKALHLSQTQTPCKPDENTAASKRGRKQEEYVNPTGPAIRLPESGRATRGGRRVAPTTEGDASSPSVHPLPGTVAEPQQQQQGGGVSEPAQHHSVIVQGHVGAMSTLRAKNYIVPGTYVLFEGDRGTDMGRVVSCELVDTPPESGNRGRGKDAIHNVISEADEKEVHVWKNVQPAEAEETLAACRALVAEKQCQLDIVSAAYQYDKKKLTLQGPFDASLLHIPLQNLDGESHGTATFPYQLDTRYLRLLQLIFPRTDTGVPAFLLTGLVILVFLYQIIDSFICTFPPYIIEKKQKEATAMGHVYGLSKIRAIAAVGLWLSRIPLSKQYEKDSEMTANNLEYYNMRTPSSTSRQNSQSCHLETIFVESLPLPTTDQKSVEDQLTNATSLELSEEVLGPPSLASLQLLEDLQEEQLMLEKLKSEDEDRFSNELNEFERMIQDHQEHLFTALNQQVRHAGKTLEEKAQSYATADRERQLARSSRSFNSLAAYRATEKAIGLSSSLSTKRALLNSIWEDNLKSRNTSLLYESLREEGEKLSEAVVKSCTRKHALRVAKMGQELHCLKDEQMAHRLANVLTKCNNNSKPIRTAVCLRPIMPSPALMDIENSFDESHERGFSIRFNCAEKTISLNSPRAEEVHLPSSSLYDLRRGADATAELFREEVLPLLSRATSDGSSATIFLYGGSASGKDELLLGVPTKKSQTDTTTGLRSASHSPQILRSSEMPLGISPIPGSRFVCRECKDQTQYDSLTNDQGLISRSLQWLLATDQEAKLNRGTRFSFTMIEINQDHVFDLLDFCELHIGDPKDMKERLRRQSQRHSKCPRELSLVQQRSVDGAISGWTTSAKSITINSATTAIEEMENALKQLRAFRGDEMDWSCILTEISFCVAQQHNGSSTMSLHMDVSHLQNLPPNVLNSTLKKNPVEPSKTCSPVRVAFCRLPGCQRANGNSDIPTISSAKKCLGGVKDVLMALQRSPFVVPDDGTWEKVSLKKALKMWNNGGACTTGGILTLSRRMPQLIPTEVRDSRLFDTSITRNGSLISHRTILSSTPVSNKGVFVPYRNQKITQLLCSALSGGSTHLLIASIAPISILETTMPFPDDEVKTASERVREAYLRYGYQAQETMSCAKFTLNFCCVLYQFSLYTRLVLIPENNNNNNKKTTTQIVSNASPHFSFAAYSINVYSLRVSHPIVLFGLFWSPAWRRISAPVFLHRRQRWFRPIFLRRRSWAANFSGAAPGFGGFAPAVFNGGVRGGPARQRFASRFFFSFHPWRGASSGRSAPGGWAGATWWRGPNPFPGWVARRGAMPRWRTRRREVPAPPSPPPGGQMGHRRDPFRSPVLLGRANIPAGIRHGAPPAKSDLLQIAFHAVRAAPGSVLGPLPFSVFIDDLLLQLESAVPRLHGRLRVDAVLAAYVDYVTLLVGGFDIDQILGAMQDLVQVAHGQGARKNMLLFSKSVFQWLWGSHYGPVASALGAATCTLEKRGEKSRKQMTITSRKRTAVTNPQRDFLIVTKP
eukprot:gene4294-3110_t